ncbi:MAG: FKBP-type peptidyl-prolyl cis-trans isomerase [Candidatus Gracilibacteria bacterium]|nr:FKBP-type peptidyl-prolyl cis-trans isomerase [Candidatus Gracilibacteria bacterium]
MKKALVMLTIAPLFLTSCLGNFGEEKESSSSDVTKTVVSKGDTVGVDYIGTLEDGTVFDSSIEEFAKKTKNYNPNSGRKYEPLVFTVGAGQMIKGFDTGVEGMKLGEKKTLVLAPVDAYGEAFTEQEIPAKYFQDIFNETVPRDNFQDVVTQTVPVSALGEQGEDLVVGKILEAGNVKAKVTKIEGENVTVTIENTQNPFYGKKLAVGLKTTFEGNDITITKLTDTELTLKVSNKANPFYGKKIAEGMEGTMPNGSTMKIIKIEEDTVTIGIPNTHELAGKTLKFDVEVKSIK